MKGRWAKRALSIMLISVFAVTLCAGIGLKTVKAEETADTLATLFSETNTYSTTSDRITIEDTSDYGAGKKYKASQFYLTYDMTEKNDNVVAAKSQITVLTHGFGSGAHAWSNKLTYDENRIGDGVEFTPTKASLIYKYWQKYGSNLKVLFAKFEELSGEERTIENILNFTYVDLTAQTAYAFNNNVFEEYDTSTTTEDLFTGFTANNHMLVLFESGVTNDSNNNVYFQFNYLLSKIAKQYEDKTNTLPKYNLVGHSRGGLTNLQYALDHPDMVDNLISIGTPYNGSTTATVFGENVCGEADALTDIIDYVKYDAYKTRWNDNYELYKKINATAIGGYSSLSFLSKLAHNDPSGEISFIEAGILDVLLDYVPLMKVIADTPTDITKILLKRRIIMLLRNNYPESKIIAFLNIFVNELFYDSSFISFANDTLVNLSSQLADGFKGFAKETRKFTENENINFTKLAAYNVPVVHNLETRDEKILNIIMSALFKPVSGFKYEVNEDGNTIKITGIDKDYLSNITSSTFVVPSTIEGKTVTEIGDSAFYGAFGDFMGKITSVVVSSNVKKIGKDAFRNNYYLTNISITNQDAEIDEGAFAECVQLTSVTLPSKLTKISDGMFSECKGLTSITLPTTVTSIGGGAFSECTNLTSVNGIEQVTEIGNFAFYNCYKLNGITLNSGLNTLGNFAFV